VRIGTAEIYRQVERLEEVVESLVIGQQWPPGMPATCGWCCSSSCARGCLDDALIDRIRRTIRDNTTPRHVPARVVQVTDIPRTKSGKIVELAVRAVVHGEPVKNVEALANPAALEQFRARPSCSPEESPMLMDSAKSSLLVVDVQERLLPAIADGEAVLRNCIWLAGAARRMGVPVVVSEQYPAGLGRPPRPAGGARRCALRQKTHFSCVADGCLTGTAVEQRRQVVVVGTEAHVCVMQTVLELRWQGKEVFLVADAVGSRKPADKEAALARMRSHGVEIVTREMVAFEWLQRSATELFARSTGTSSATTRSVIDGRDRPGSPLDRLSGVLMLRLDR
jgi:nicotinamidase-related amidase